MGFNVPDLFNRSKNRSDALRVNSAFLSQPAKQKDTRLLISEVTELSKFASSNTYNSIVLIYQKYDKNQELLRANNILTQDLFQLKELQDRYLSDTVKIFLKNRRDLDSIKNAQSIAILDNALDQQIEILRRGVEKRFEIHEIDKTVELAVNGNFLSTIFPEEAQEVKLEEQLAQKEKVRIQNKEILAQKELTQKELTQKENINDNVIDATFEVVHDKEIQVEEEKSTEVLSEDNELKNKKEEEIYINRLLFEGAISGKKTPEEITGFYSHIKESGVIEFLWSDKKTQDYLIQGIGRCDTPLILSLIAYQLEIEKLGTYTYNTDNVFRTFSNVKTKFNTEIIFMDTIVDKNQICQTSLKINEDGYIQANKKIIDDTKLDNETVGIPVKDWIKLAKETKINVLDISHRIKQKERFAHEYFKPVRDLISSYLARVPTKKNNPLIEIKRHMYSDSFASIYTISVHSFDENNQHCVYSLAPNPFEMDGFVRERGESKLVVCHKETFKQDGTVDKTICGIEKFERALKDAREKQNQVQYFIGNGRSKENKVKYSDVFGGYGATVEQIARHIPKDTPNIGIERDIFGKATKIEVLDKYSQYNDEDCYHVGIIKDVKRHTANSNVYSLSGEIRAERTDRADRVLHRTEDFSWDTFVRDMEYRIFVGNYNFAKQNFLKKSENPEFYLLKDYVEKQQEYVQDMYGSQNLFLSQFFQSNENFGQLTANKKDGAYNATITLTEKDVESNLALLPGEYIITFTAVGNKETQPGYTSNRVKSSVDTFIHALETKIIAHAITKKTGIQEPAIANAEIATYQDLLRIKKNKENPLILPAESLATESLTTGPLAFANSLKIKNTAYPGDRHEMYVSEEQAVALLENVQKRIKSTLQEDTNIEFIYGPDNNILLGISAPSSWIKGKNVRNTLKVTETGLKASYSRNQVRKYAGEENITKGDSIREFFSDLRACIKQEKEQTFRNTTFESIRDAKAKLTIENDRLSQMIYKIKENSHYSRDITMELSVNNNIKMNSGADDVYIKPTYTNKKSSKSRGE